ncbi:MAG: hypothetical protein EOP14_04310 [Pseudomonas sp.]|nr:MAG: hypothetical protein EOP14_04310 [Pseudomonas sp.]
MSIQALLKLRKEAGKVPPAVWVVIGQVPARLKDLPDCIHVSFGSFPEDWRPIVGLHVDVFDLANSDYLLSKTLEAIDAAKPKSVAVASHHGVMGLSDQHETVMRRIWRHLGTA